jgi:hypothetical protein
MASRTMYMAVPTAEPPLAAGPDPIFDRTKRMEPDLERVAAAGGVTGSDSEEIYTDRGIS